MIIVLIRTIIMYFAVLFAIRIMGKSELSEMSPCQMVIIIMMAELAALPMEDTGAALINGAAAIFTLMLLQTSISALSLKSPAFKSFVNGSPSLLIDKGRINVKEMKRLRLSLDDLLEQLRLQKVPSLSQVDYAVMEANGQLSVITKDEASCLPSVIISDGTLYRDNMNQAGFTEKDLERYGNINEIFLAFTDQQGQLHVYNCGGSCAKEVSL